MTILVHAVYRLGGRRCAGPVGIADQFVEAVGTICQVSPKRSLRQPHCDSLATVGQAVPVVVDLVLVLQCTVNNTPG